MMHDTKMLYVVDLDDTLYLERDFVRSGFKAVDIWLSRYTPVNNFFEAAWGLFRDGARGDIFNQVLDTTGYYSEGLVPILVGVFRNHIPEISLLPDAAEFLKAIPKERLALITDGYTEVQWNKVNALNLEKHIGKIFVTGDWGKRFWKPNQRAFLEASKGFHSRNCLYIGDNPDKDFQAPRALDWLPSIRIKRDGSLHNDKSTPPKCREINSLLELFNSVADI
jgi:putative hydrolase of the HAD superfamily